MTAEDHLAQLNVGRSLGPMDSATMAGFVARLDEINALADGATGFVWRLVGAGNNATDILPTDDPLFIINLSVWRSIEELQSFTYRTAHVEVLRRRRDWFERHVEQHLVAWWVPAGHIPSIDEALDRLARIRRDGPTPDAFTLKQPFEAPGGSAPSTGPAA